MKHLLFAILLLPIPALSQNTREALDKQCFENMKWVYDRTLDEQVIKLPIKTRSPRSIRPKKFKRFVFESEESCKKEHSKDKRAYDDECFEAFIGKDINAELISAEVKHYNQTFKVYFHNEDNCRKFQKDGTVKRVYIESARDNLLINSSTSSDLPRFTGDCKSESIPYCNEKIGLRRPYFEFID